VGHPSPPICLVILPNAFVLASIRPQLNAHSISFSIFLIPLALIQSSVPYILELIYVNSFNIILKVNVFLVQLERKVFIYLVRAMVLVVRSVGTHLMRPVFLDLIHVE